MDEPGKPSARPIIDACWAFNREKLADALIPDPDSVKRAMDDVKAAVRSMLQQAGVIDRDESDGGES